MPPKKFFYTIKKNHDTSRDNNLGQSILFQKKKNFTKIAAFILISILIIACNSEKRVPSQKQLLVKNEIIQNNKLIKNQDVYDQLYQQPNSRPLFGYPFQLNVYNLANPNPDSTFNLKYQNKEKKYNREVKWLSEKQIRRLRKSFWHHGIHTFLKQTGEAPVIADTSKSRKSLIRLKSHYFNNGYFNIKATYKLDSLSPKKAKMKYTVTTGNPFFLDTLTTTIQTAVLDSLFKTKKSLIISGNQYKTEVFENEKDRISALFRNHGAYRFQPNYITFDIDTINKKNKANINLSIDNYAYLENDSTKTEPFKLYKISDINIYTDYKSSNHNSKIKDSVTYNNMNLYGFEKIKYTPHAITDAIFIVKGELFADNKTVLSTRYLNNLKIFNYPTIQYEVDKRDSTAQSLIAKIYLTPRKKYSLGYTLDLTHSNIQNYGIAGSITETVRNVFNGAETLELSARGNIGASDDIADSNTNFLSEYGIDAKLNFPRILFPFKTEKIIPKSMIPSTILSMGFSKQTNIGLDKESVSGAYSYSWTPKKNNTTRFDLFNVQFVNNLNPENYYNVYESSYDALNAIAKNPSVATDPAYFDKNGDLIIENGTTGFTNDVLSDKTSLKPSDEDYQNVNSIEQQRIRLTDNNFIMATNIVFTKTTKKDLQDNDFYMFRTKIESAGTLLSAISSIGNLPKNSSGNYEIFNLEYAEYLKTEFDFIKYWDINKGKVFAIRTFFGVAIPYGNSDFVPFTKSYYAGGSNDNRAWQPYRLGPGSSPSTNNFNEANLKIAISGEYRFLIGGKFNGALFADAGNIWNVFDGTTFEPAQFNGLKDLSKIALGTGFGVRYDLGFFVIRSDVGFKTYNPANKSAERWFNEYNFANSVFNFGINYPF